MRTKDRSFVGEPIPETVVSFPFVVGHGIRRHSQTRTDSFMESITNTAIGFVLSMITWQFVAMGFGLPMPLRTNLEITGIFTVVSIARQYVLRRAFDGRSPWQALKGIFA